MKLRTCGIVLIFLCAIAASVFLYVKKDSIPEVPAQTAVSAQPPVFAWKFEKAQSLNPDGIPQTVVSLDATYPNGTLQHKAIDTTDGSCNALPDADKDSVANTATIQCYAAGFGYTFRILKGDHSYLVQRKALEEATPEQEPPVYEYETVSEFPFSA